MAKRPPSSWTIGRSSGGITGRTSRIIQVGRCRRLAEGLDHAQPLDRLLAALTARGLGLLAEVGGLQRRGRSGLSSSLIAGAPIPALKTLPNFSTYSRYSVSVSRSRGVSDSSSGGWSRSPGGARSSSPAPACSASARGTLGVGAPAGRSRPRRASRADCTRRAVCSRAPSGARQPLLDAGRLILVEDGALLDHHLVVDPVARARSLGRRLACRAASLDPGVDRRPPTARSVGGVLLALGLEAPDLAPRPRPDGR